MLTTPQTNLWWGEYCRQYSHQMKYLELTPTGCQSQVNYNISMFELYNAKSDTVFTTPLYPRTDGYCNIPGT